MKEYIKIIVVGNIVVGMLMGVEEKKKMQMWENMEIWGNMKIIM